ncbi:MAG: hypothetical protein AAGB11_01555 [Pseudomonadota bacterium]
MDDDIEDEKKELVEVRIVPCVIHHSEKESRFLYNVEGIYKATKVKLTELRAQNLIELITGRRQLKAIEV